MPAASSKGSPSVPAHSVGGITARWSNPQFDYSCLAVTEQHDESSKVILLDGDAWRAIAIGTTGAQTARLAMTCRNTARELLGSAAQELWLKLLRHDFKGDADAAVSILGEAASYLSAFSLYSAIASVRASLQSSYAVTQGNIARPPHINGAAPDAIVVPNHPQLLDTGCGAAHAVHVAAGPELHHHIETLLNQKPQGFDIGSAVTCPGFRTGSRVIIFVISPLSLMPNATRTELLTRSYRNAFSAIREANAPTAALAAIATGVGGISPTQAGNVCAREALVHLALGGGACTTVCFDRAGTDGFQKERSSVLDSPLAVSKGAEQPAADIDVDPTNVLMGLLQQMQQRQG